MAHPIGKCKTIAFVTLKRNRARQIVLECGRAWHCQNWRERLSKNRDGRNDKSPVHDTLTQKEQTTRDHTDLLSAFHPKRPLALHVPVGPADIRLHRRTGRSLSLSAGVPDAPLRSTSRHDWCRGDRTARASAPDTHRSKPGNPCSCRAGPTSPRRSASLTAPAGPLPGTRPCLVTHHDWRRACRMQPPRARGYQRDASAAPCLRQLKSRPRSVPSPFVSTLLKPASRVLTSTARAGAACGWAGAAIARVCAGTAGLLAAAEPAKAKAEITNRE